MQLTEIKIKNLKPKDKPFKIFDGQGLYLLIEVNGSKKWRLKYRIDGKEKLAALGIYPQMGLKEARLKAGALRLEIAQGIDPIAKKRKTANSGGIMCGEIIKQWREKFAVSLAPATIKKHSIILERHVIPVLENVAAADLTPPFILNEILRPVEKRGTIETAHRIKILLGQICRYAIACGFLDRDPTQDLKNALTPMVVTHRASIIEEKALGRLLSAIDNYSGHIVTNCALRLLPLVFVRPGELRHAEWAEINWDESIWRIPEHKMKMRKIHLVPLARQSLKILHELKKWTGHLRWLFPGQRSQDRPLSDAALTAALRYLGYAKEEVSAHGFRSTASTILNEQGYNWDWIERQLAHAESNSVRAAYNYAEYLPERRKMMQQWADYLDSLRRLPA